MGTLTLPKTVGSSLHAVIPAPGRGERSVVLTFDDGPRRGDTDLVAAELAHAGVHATFFMLLVRAQADRTLPAELASAGHDIALHGVDHHRLTGTDPAQLARTLRDAAAALADLSGTTVTFFRPPYGAQNAQVWTAARDAELIPVVWQRECREWDASAPAAFDELDDLPLGAIILAHDTVASPADGAEPVDVAPIDRRVFTAEVLERVFAQGLTATSLSRALSSGEPSWRVWLDTPAVDGVA